VRQGSRWKFGLERREALIGENGSNFLRSDGGEQLAAQNVPFHRQTPLIVVQENPFLADPPKP
jgi:hypothetical protein